MEVVAEGRDDWVGWFELLRQDVNWKATFNTGRVVSEVRPDVLITVEVENRPTLERFNEQVLRAQFNFSYSHLMVVDGNDERGIDIGILSQFPIAEIRSHVDDAAPNGEPLFSRDCPEYDIFLPTGDRLVVIPNHLKSKRNGNDQASQERGRRRKRIAPTPLPSLRCPDYPSCCWGDLNDTPDSLALASLFTEGFQDVRSHPTYPYDRPGTYETGLPIHKLDYLIMSPELRGRLKDTGIERRGSYHPHTEPFDTVTKASEEASDHHLVWANFDFGG